jgi:5-methylthioadenosine/S-adenosylhomocysteine deaminase
MRSPVGIRERVAPVTHQERASLLFADVGVVTVDDHDTVHERGWVHVEEGRIEGIWRGEAPADVRRSVDAVIDARGHALMPGMTNGHTHLFQTFFRGLGDDKSLLDWLRDYIWPAAAHLTAADAELAATVGLIENLRTGATSVIDHAYIHADPETDDAMCRAADRLGIRYLLARGWADRNYEPRLQETPEQIRRRGSALAERWHGHDDGRIRVEHAPLIPWGCSDETMRITRAASEGWGGGLHVHCAETLAEIDMSLSERAVRHVPWLDSVGALGPRTQLAHSVWLDDDELDLIARSGASVVHCPVSNMYLASGVARVPEMLERAIPVCLASDGPGSNNRQDLFEVLKTTVLLQKVHTLDPMVLQPEDALRMACRFGAHAFGLGDRGALGSIEVGNRADLVLVDLRSVFAAPVHRLPSALVFNASPRDVRMVIVDGRVVLRDGVVVEPRTGAAIDEHALLSRAEAACRDLFTRAGLRTGLHDRA